MKKKLSFVNIVKPRGKQLLMRNNFLSCQSHREGFFGFVFLNKGCSFSLFSPETKKSDMQYNVD